MILSAAARSVLVLKDNNYALKCQRSVAGGRLACKGETGWSGAIITSAKRIVDGIFGQANGGNRVRKGEED